MRTAYRISVGNLSGEMPLGIDDAAVLRWTLNKLDIRVWLDWSDARLGPLAGSFETLDPQKTGSLLTCWVTVSFSKWTVLHSVNLGVTPLRSLSWQCLFSSELCFRAFLIFHHRSLALQLTFSSFLHDLIYFLRTLIWSICSPCKPHPFLKIWHHIWHQYTAAVSKMIISLKYLNIISFYPLKCWIKVINMSRQIL
jgi:hypothetical protein